MLIDILKDRRFNMAFSFILGVGIVIIILKPICKGKQCVREKAPSISDVKDKVFNLYEKCYTFEHAGIKCPQNGDIIEPFIHQTADKPSVIEYKGEFERR